MPFVRAIIFDYFGVIQPDVLAKTYAHFGGDPEADAQFLSDTITALNRGFIDSSKPVFAERLGISVEEWSNGLDSFKKQDPELLEYIRSLRSRYKIGLLSNVGPRGLEQLFAPVALGAYFDAWLSSGDVGLAKPDPAIYRLMAERLNVPTAECVMIDDQPSYCDGARAVGMQAIVYKSLTQCKHDLQLLL